MGKRALSARLEAETVEALDGWAAAHEVTRTEALERAVTGLVSATEGTGEATRAETRDDGTEAVISALMASNADLRAALIDARANASTLTAQLAVKDEQIARANELTDQAHRLHMAEVQRALPPARVGIVGRLRRIMGGES